MSPEQGRILFFLTCRLLLALVFVIKTWFTLCKMSPNAVYFLAFNITIMAWWRKRKTQMNKNSRLRRVLLNFSVFGVVVGAVSRSWRDFVMAYWILLCSKTDFEAPGLFPNAAGINKNAPGGLWIFSWCVSSPTFRFSSVFSNEVKLDLHKLCAVRTIKRQSRNIYRSIVACIFCR